MDCVTNTFPYLWISFLLDIVKFLIGSIIHTAGRNGDISKSAAQDDRLDLVRKEGASAEKINSDCSAGPLTECRLLIGCVGGYESSRRMNA